MNTRENFWNVYSFATNQTQGETATGTSHDLLLDFSNQGHMTKSSTNLMKKIVNVYSSFPTNYPCNQAVHHKDNRFLVTLDNFLEYHC